jgi:hypothetical protein
LSEFEKNVKICYEFLKKAAGHLDSRCQLLLAEFSGLYPVKIGFTKLFERVKHMGFTKPTLSAHLNHLKKTEFIDCQVDTTSRLYLKPRLYGVSSKWVKLAGDLLIDMEEKNTQMQKAVEQLNAEQLIGFMGMILSYYVWKLLRYVIEIDNDSYRKHAVRMIFDYFDSWTAIFRKRVDELNWKEETLKLINAHLLSYQEYGLSPSESSNGKKASSV